MYTLKCHCTNTLYMQYICTWIDFVWHILHSNDLLQMQGGILWIIPIDPCNSIISFFYCNRISFGSKERSQLELSFTSDVHSIQNPSSAVQPRRRVGRESVRRRRSSDPWLVLALGKTFAGTLLAAAFFKLCQDLLGFVSPQILKYVSLNCLFKKLIITLCACTRGKVFGSAVVVDTKITKSGDPSAWASC